MAWLHCLVKQEAVSDNGMILVQVCHRIGIFDFSADDDEQDERENRRLQPADQEDNDRSDEFTDDRVSTGCWSERTRDDVGCTAGVSSRMEGDEQESCNDTSYASDDRTRHPEEEEEEEEEPLDSSREMTVMSVLSQRDVLQLIFQNRSR